MLKHIGPTRSEPVRSDLASKISTSAVRLLRSKYSLIRTVVRLAENEIILPLRLAGWVASEGTLTEGLRRRSRSREYLWIGVCWQREDARQLRRECHRSCDVDG